MILRDLLGLLDSIAPLRYAESWDNVGLIVGDPIQRVSRAMLAIDYTPDVAAEARRAGCDLVIAYHPPIFAPVKKLTAPALMYDAIRHGVAVYSPHTALDVADGGTNDLLADVLGLVDRQPLRLIEPKSREHKLTTFVPADAVERVADALFAAGAGRIGNYTRCSFRTAGTGTFLGDEKSNPTVGEAGKFERAEEVKLETLCPINRLPEVLAALRASHPYEEPAFDLIQLAAPQEKLGQGRIGNMPETALPILLERIKADLGLSHLLVAGMGLAAEEAASVSSIAPTSTLAEFTDAPIPPPARTITRAAVLAGAGREHVKDAIAQGAQLYLTGEIPHHDALAAAAAGMVVVATLHSNSERASLRLLRDRLAALTAEIPFLLSTADRDPFAIL
jgi:dinuclear metal center YbgI/SA1388 family protein